MKWIHLSVDGETCPRCTETGQEVKKAVSLLEKALAPLGIEVEFEEVELMPQEFMRDPMRSNEVWVNGRLIEDWLGAKKVKTPCCDVCGDAECRAVEINGQTNETITAELIIKAGLLAAADLVGKNKVVNGVNSQCCG